MKLPPKMNIQSLPPAHADELLRLINEACYTDTKRDSVVALQEIWDLFAYAER